MIPTRKSRTRGPTGDLGVGIAIGALIVGAAQLGHSLIKDAHARAARFGRGGFGKQSKDGDDILWAAIRFQPAPGKRAGRPKLSVLDPQAIDVAITPDLDHPPVFGLPPLIGDWGVLEDGTYEVVTWFKRRAGGRLSSVTAKLAVHNPTAGGKPIHLTYRVPGKK